MINYKASIFNDKTKNLLEEERAFNVITTIGHVYENVKNWVLGYINKCIFASFEYNRKILVIEHPLTERKSDNFCIIFGSRIL